MTTDLQSTIEQAWDARAGISPSSGHKDVHEAVLATLEVLDRGKLRVAEKSDGQWVVHQWVKKAVLLSFRLENNRVMGDGSLRFYDKVATNFESYDGQDFAAAGFREIGRASLRERGGQYV